MTADPNAVPSWEVQRLMQSFSDFSAAANRIYDGQLDLAKDAQVELRKAQARIEKMVRAMLYADEQLRRIDEDTTTKSNQICLDRALDLISEYIPTEVPF